MMEQWEMCEQSGDYVTFLAPKSFERIEIKVFVKRHTKQIEKIDGPLGKNHQFVSNCLLLSDRWEPYGSHGFGHLYRRKYHG